MTTVQRRAMRHTGPTKIDKGYARPQITDLAAAISGVISEGAYGGVAPVSTPTSPTMTWDSDSGKLWLFANSAWMDTGITIPAA